MKSFLLLSCIVPLFSFAQKVAQPFRLNANIENLGIKEKVYLFYSRLDSLIKDSAYFVNGKGSFKGTLFEPSHATLRIDRDGKVADIVECYIEPGIVYFNGKDSLSHGKVGHSSVNKNFYEWKKETDFYKKALTRLTMVAYALSKDDRSGEKGNALNVQYRLNADTLRQRNIFFIKQHPKSFVSLQILKSITGIPVNVQDLKPLYQGLDITVKNTPSGIAYAKVLEKASKVDVGSVAPVFASAQVDGSPIDLKIELSKSKLLLIDFWASWCAPCRAENPNLVKAYHAYHDKGFNIIGISLDQNAAAWKKAIEKDGLDWIHASSLLGWKEPVAQLYNVEAVPANFLIDANGRIVAQSLRGEALEHFLARALGK